MNLFSVTPTFQSARLAGWKTGATKPNGFMTPMRLNSRRKPPTNRKVGRAVLCAPTPATTISSRPKDGAHGMTRPTSARRFIPPMHGKILEALLPTTCSRTFGFFRDFE